MSLISLISAECDVSEKVKHDISLLPIHSSENFKFSNEYRAFKSPSQVMHEITIQKRLATEAQKEIAGYSSLKRQLELLEPSAIIQMRFIESETWDGRVFESNNRLQGVLLGKKRPDSVKTPPNWDGSLEMLEAYNKSKMTE